MSNTPKSDYALTEEEVRFFYKNGYIGPFKVYEPEELDEQWKVARLQLLDRSKAVYQSNTFSEHNNLANYERHLDVPFLSRHVTHPRIVHRIRSLIGNDVLCWRSEFFAKYPGDAGTDWHQARTFAGATGGTPHIIWPDNEQRKGTLTAWTAFTDVTVDTACMCVVPGTHNTMFYDEQKRMPYKPDYKGSEKDGVSRGFFGYDYRDLQIDPNWKPDESNAVKLEMKRGESFIFWSTILHSSTPHAGKTKEMRLAYTCRYVPPQVLIHPGQSVLKEFGGEVSLDNYGAVLVSGENKYTHNKILAKNTRGEPFIPA